MGLGVAVLIDATLVRAVLLPASMTLLGIGTGTCRVGWNGSRTSVRWARPRFHRRRERGGEGAAPAAS